MTHPTKNKSISEKLIWHLKVVVGAVLISLLFSTILLNQLFHEGLIRMIVLTFVQLEIFLWLGAWFFHTIQPDDSRFIQKMILRLLLFYILVLGIAFILLLVLFTFYFIEQGGQFSHYFSDLKAMELKGFLTGTFIGFGIGAVFFFYAQWAEALKRVQKLKEEKLIFQYETLKSQVNPHFLFNSLNSLTSLIRTDPDMSEEFVMKLSSVYRYVLENREKETVLLSDELEFVKNYFALQKIRDGEKIALSVEINEVEKMKVLPVSLQLLIENAIKHNSATRTNPLEIVIHNEGMDKLVVRNIIQRKTHLNSSSKIGLKNLNQRSLLILEREIEVSETNDEFVVKIPVKVDL